LFTGPVVLGKLVFKYVKELDGEHFQKRYGALTDGMKITGELGQASTANMTLWFFLRRFLTALVLVFLGNQSAIFQISLL